MYLQNPVLKDSYGRKEQISDFLGASSDWPAIFKTQSISFDFFVNWKSYTLSKFFFIKKTYTGKLDFDRMIKNESNFKDLKFASSIKPNFFQLVFNEREFDENMEIYTFNPALRYKKVSLESIKTKVKEWSGGPQYMGSKGLFLATTEFERGLSTTDACWAGDCDCMLVREGHPIAIIEFQKRNKEPESFLCETVLFDSLYSGTVKNQKKKFDRLHILSEQFWENRIPLFIFHYHTDKNISYCGIEKIEKVNNKLKSVYLKKIEYLSSREETLNHVIDVILS